MFTTPRYGLLFLKVIFHLRASKIEFQKSLSYFSLICICLEWYLGFIMGPHKNCECSVSGLLHPSKHEYGSNKMGELM